MNSKMMANCLHCQILLFCIAFFYASPYFIGFSLLGEMSGVESLQEAVLSLAETLFILLVVSLIQILISSLNNGFEVITQYKLHLWL